MSGRRSHQRFAVAVPWTGAVRILREVVVQRTGGRELLAVSHAPAVVGTEMSLDLIGGGRSLEMRVQVLESRPVIIDGAVRHRIRLALAATNDDACERVAGSPGGAEQSAEARS